jgi:hypothetical protein
VSRDAGSLESGSDFESPTTLELADRGNKDLIGHLIELNLIQPVRAAMNANPSTKFGRPYLDYALRYDRSASWRALRGESLGQLSGHSAMVELLLNVGCDVNEPIHIYGERTVWDLYLAFLFAQERLERRHYKVTWLLINHGAKPIKTCAVGDPQRQTEYSMKEVLASAFGDQEAENMCEQISKNEVGGGWWFWLISWISWLSNTTQ